METTEPGYRKSTGEETSGGLSVPESKYIPRYHSK
jgi:hypothetical protein